MAVYFIQRGKDGPIKIGFTSTHVLKRRNNLQNANAEWLYVIGLADGDAAREREIHAQFHDIRLEREWFSPTTELLAFAAQYFRREFVVEPRERVRLPIPMPTSPPYVCDRDMARRVLDRFGGPSKAARLINTDTCRISISTVHAWRSQGQGIPNWRYWYILSAAEKGHIDLPYEFVEGASSTAPFDDPAYRRRAFPGAYSANDQRVAE